MLHDTLDITVAYLFYLCRNGACVDGNKRTALAACLVFLDINGLLPDPSWSERSIDARESFVLDVAASRLDRDGTAKRLKALLKIPSRVR